MEPTFEDKFNRFLNGLHPKRKNTLDTIKQDALRNITKDKADGIIKTLQEHSKHVAWIRAKAKGSGTWSSGTFFLLTKSIGLTSYNALKNILNYIIEIRFFHTQKEAEDGYLQARVVESDEKLNFAYLQIKSRYPGCPEGLLRHLAPPPQDGPVAIIGHPEDKHKQIHVCSVLTFKHYLRPFLINVLPLYRSRKLLSSESITNEARLYEEASGAPMFNDRGELVAMHSGGNTVDASATTKTFIECGRSMVEIIIIGAVYIKDLRCEFLKLLKSNKDLESYVFSGHLTHMKNFIAILEELWVKERNVDHLEDDEKDEWKCHHLTVEFTISNEDDLNNVLKTCDNYSSQRTSILSRYLSPTLYSEKPQEPPDSRTRGCYKCGSCDVCPYMLEGSSFISYRTKETYHMYQSINCNSTHVIYVISCSECGLQYVGLTTDKLKKRISDHIKDIKERGPKNKGPEKKGSEIKEKMCEHFNKHGDIEECFKFQGIQMIENPTKYTDSLQILRDIEKVWIWRLQTAKKNGLNIQNSSIKLPI